MTIPPFPRHFVTVLAFSQSRHRAGALGTGPRCAGAGAPRDPCPRSIPPPPRRTWRRGWSRDARPPPAPSHRDRLASLRASGTQHSRVVTARVPAGPCHAGLAPSPGPLSPRGRCRSAVPCFPCRWTGDAGLVAAFRSPRGQRECPDGRGDSALGEGSSRGRAARHSTFQPCPVSVAVPAPRGTNPSALAGIPWGHWLAHARPGAPSGLMAWPDRRGRWQGNGGRWSGRTAGQHWRRGDERAGQAMPRRG